MEQTKLEFEEMSYRQVLDTIESAIKHIESGDMKIENIITEVKKVSELITFCKNKLFGIETELNQIFEEKTE
jgi:exodeoxyribonuclease VII small subunit